MEIAISAPVAVQKRLVNGGWRLVDPRQVTQDPWTYQHFLRGSRGVCVNVCYVSKAVGLATVARLI